MYSLLTKQFIRSRMASLSLVLLLLMGLIAILVGKQFLVKQEDTILKVTEHQRAHIGRNVAGHDDMGLLLYYLRFAFISKPEKLSALSIGQRDINPGVQRVTIRTLEAQKYDTDLVNPLQLHSGNLDLSFVIIYLFPLVIIAFSYNLFSEEEESGIWRMIAVQSRSAVRFLLVKLSIRALFVFAVLAILFIISVAVLFIPLTEAFAAYVVLSVLYLVFWFTLCFLIALLKRSSGFNIVALLSFWIMLTILIPACINNLVGARYPIPETLATMVKQRNSYHEKWDMEKSETINKFYAHYPQFSKYGVPNETFSWLWYYAMQQMGDDESRAESETMVKKIRQREKMSRAVAAVIPSLHTQLQLNALAQTSLSDYLRLLDSADTFHERLRLYFYPKIFEGADVKLEPWESFTPEFLPGTGSVKWCQAILPPLIVIVLFVFWAAYLVRRF